MVGRQPGSNPHERVATSYMCSVRLLLDHARPEVDGRVRVPTIDTKRLYRVKDGVNLVLQGSMAPLSDKMPCGDTDGRNPKIRPVSVTPGVVVQVYTSPGSRLSNGIALRADRRVGKYLDYEQKRVSFHTARDSGHGSFVCPGAGDSAIRYGPQGWARDRSGQRD